MTTKNAHFFTGENSYLLQKEISRWKIAFTEKHGAENLLEIRSSDAALSDLLDAVSVMPFIAERRLVIVHGTPRIDREEVASLLSALHPKTVLLIADPSPDKRLSSTKEFMKLMEVTTFVPMNPKELHAWASGIAKDAGASITDQAFRTLREIVGEDQWMLDTEIRKLASFTKGEITEKHVEELAVPSGEQVVWRLTDLVGSGKPLEAIRFLRSRLERGEDAYGLWVIILSMVRNVALVWSGIQEGLKGERDLASAFGMHFLSVRGLLPLARSLREDDVRSLVEFVAEADLALKSGGLQYTSERQDEVIAVTESAIMRSRPLE